MAENTKIQWADHTWNPWRGCSKVNAGCTNCYAADLSKRNPGTLGIWGTEKQGATRVVAAEAQWNKPFAWDKDSKLTLGQMPFYGEHASPRVFPSLCDPFEDWKGPIVDSQGVTQFESSDGTGWLGRADDEIHLKPLTMNRIRQRMFETIDVCPNVDFLLLTKRPENIRRMTPQYNYNGCLTGDCPHDKQSDCKEDFHRENLWLGTSVANQEAAEQAIPELLKCRDLAAKLFLSVEPLVGPVDLSPWISEIDWCIIGGESGGKARPCNIDWIRDVVRQCKDGGVPVFVKQLGAKPYERKGSLKYKLISKSLVSHIDRSELILAKDGVLIRDPKGGDMDEWPEDLRVREMPV